MSERDAETSGANESPHTSVSSTCKSMTQVSSRHSLMILVNIPFPRDKAYYARARRNPGLELEVRLSGPGSYHRRIALFGESGVGLVSKTQKQYHYSIF
jgi:hypothetical protein